jgi:hypothetical protein
VLADRGGTLTRIDQADLTYLALAPSAAGAQDGRTDASRRRGAMQQHTNAAAIEGAGHEEASMSRSESMAWPRGVAVQLVLIAIAIVLLRLL